jgi:hypothetical protein
MSAPTFTESDWLGGATAPPAPKPHAGGRPAKGYVGKQRKIHCERCGFIAYVTRAALARCGFPTCACGEPMVLANLRDRAIVEWDALERELASYGRDAYNAAMRELGFTAMIEPKRVSARLGGGAQKRCRWEGGYCAKFASGRYCAEHDPHETARRTARYIDIGRAA